MFQNFFFKSAVYATKANVFFQQSELFYEDIHFGVIPNNVYAATLRHLLRHRKKNTITIWKVVYQKYVWQLSYVQ